MKLYFLYVYSYIVKVNINLQVTNQVANMKKYNTDIYTLYWEALLLAKTLRNAANSWNRRKRHHYVVECKSS